jgi:ferric uptake regulator, fur family
MKYSRQREAVIECLRNRHDHPTADALFQTLREEDPKISLGTVYRNLGLLVELGEIRKISTGDGCERYDYITEDHYHFICNHCGRIFDLDTKQIEGIHNSVVNENIATIDSHELTFYGICKECYKKGVN